MRVVTPPEEPDRHRGCVSQATEDKTLSPVLRQSALSRDTDALARGDHGEPIIDVVDLLDLGSTAGRPQVRRGGAGARVDGEDATNEIGQPQLAAPRERVVRGHRAVTGLQPDDDVVESTVGDARGVTGGSQHGDVAGPFRESTRSDGQP